MEHQKLWIRWRRIKGYQIKVHQAFPIRILVTPVLNEMPERGGLTHGRSGTGALRHIFFVIRIFRIQHGAVWSDGNSGIF
jgi:hypothetical protein